MISKRKKTVTLIRRQNHMFKRYDGSNNIENKLGDAESNIVYDRNVGSV